jgi:hypothetical protein
MDQGGRCLIYRVDILGAHSTFTVLSNQITFYIHINVNFLHEKKNNTIPLRYHTVFLQYQ